MTTAFAAMVTRSPTSIGPSTQAPAPIVNVVSQNGLAAERMLVSEVTFWCR